MKYENLYHTIFKRKSIRKYNQVPLSKNTLDNLSAYINKVKPLYGNINVEMKIVTQKVVKNLLPIKAPYYILVSSEKKEGYLMNVGFMLQQVDLFLSENGLGSCWVGMAQPKKQILKQDKLEYVIALAFGESAEPLYRESIVEFKRKPIEQIRDGDKKDKFIETVRLAPSATNRQPWFFKVVNDKIHIYCIKSNFIKAILFKKLNQIDMGIGICHLWITMKYLDKEFNPKLDKGAAKNSPKGYYYVMSLIIN